MTHAQHVARRGSLVIVGSGVMAWGQMTAAARNSIQGADLVLFGVADPWTVRSIRDLNPQCESLPYPRDGSLRRDIYAQMVEHMLRPVRAGKRVCVVIYGHPSVLVDAVPKALAQAEQEGFVTQLLPGVSALDCLFADLRFDPGANGCLVVEATDLIERVRPFDATTPLVVLQLGVIRNPGCIDPTDAVRIHGGLHALAQVLCERFSESHVVTVYEAAILPTQTPRIDRVPLAELTRTPVNELSTLWVPHERAAPKRSQSTGDRDRKG